MIVRKLRFASIASMIALVAVGMPPAFLKASSPACDCSPFRLGITFVTKSKGPGLVVRKIVIDMPAHRMGLEPGDVILRINSVAVNTEPVLQRVLSQAQCRGGALCIAVRKCGTHCTVLLRGQLDVTVSLPTIIIQPPMIEGPPPLVEVPSRP